MKLRKVVARVLPTCVRYEAAPSRDRCKLIVAHCKLARRKSIGNLQLAVCNFRIGAQFATLLVLFATAVSATTAALAQDKPASHKPAGKQLLDDLEADLLRDLPPARPAKGQPEENHPSKTNRRLQDELGAGEDLGSAPEDPLVAIGRQMRTIEERIAQRDTSDLTQSLQRDVVAELEKLIQAASRQGSAGNSGAGTGQAGAGTGEARPGAAQESTDRVGKPHSESAETADVRDVLRRIWGHLPEKTRTEMQNAFSDRFLPKYEKLIEEYYKRLAEE